MSSAFGLVFFQLALLSASIYLFVLGPYPAGCIVTSRETVALENELYEVRVGLVRDVSDLAGSGVVLVHEDYLPDWDVGTHHECLIWYSNMLVLKTSPWNNTVSNLVTASVLFCCATFIPVYAGYLWIRYRLYPELLNRFRKFDRFLGSYVPIPKPYTEDYLPI